MTNLRLYMNRLEKEGNLLHIDDPLSPKYEIPAALKGLDGRGAVIFENVEGNSSKITAAICGSRENIYAALGIEADTFHKHLHFALNNPTPCKIEDGPVKEVVEPPNLSNIPILTFYDRDQGPYITSAVVYAKSPNGAGENASFHRLNVLDNNRLSIRIQPGHLFQFLNMAKSMGRKSLDVSISIGLHPAIMLAGASPAPFGTSEFDVANTLLGGELKLTECPHVDALAPADAELVLEGKIRLDEEANEGPFVSVTGTWKPEGLQPVVEVVGMMHREDYIYQALLAASIEHRLLEGMPNEIPVWEYVSSVVPTIRGVNMTINGCSWLHCVVSFEKLQEGDPKSVIMAMFTANPALKHAIVVDSDIDPYDMGQVEWAIATRLQGDKDILVIPNTYISGLDPSSDTENKLGCKLGIDATRTLSKSEEIFKRGVIPVSDRVGLLLEKLTTKYHH